MNTNDATRAALRRAHAGLRAAENYTKDSKVVARRAAQECKTCHYFYRPTVGGRAMTRRPCKLCGEDQMYTSTYTMPYCHGCAVANNICRDCGADMDMQERS